MKTTFNTVYLPIKSGITGNILKHEQSKEGELIQSINVNNDPFRGIPNRPIIAIFQYKQQVQRLYFGTTMKEIKSLVQHINDFEFDPYLFLNQ